MTMHDLTPVPPSGWNSYDCYGCAANERVTLANLDAFAEKLVPHGYEYFVIDNGWFGEYVVDPGEEFTKERHASDIRLDAFGRVQPSVCSFPNGLKPVIDRAHELGIKFGVHMMRGIPRKAVELNLPVFGTDLRARDIADPEDTCDWCEYNYGVDMSLPGAQAWYNSLITMLAEWGVDFIKYDDIVPYPREIEAVVNAIEACDRDIALSLSPGGKIRTEDIPVYRMANTLRVSGDIWDDRDGINRAFERWEMFSTIDMGRTWVDLDMICFGDLMVWNPVEGRETCTNLCGKGTARRDQFTDAQRRTFITMRALAASPLFMGGELTTSGEDVFALITEPRMLACNRNGITGTLVKRDGALDVWQTPRKDGNGGWLGIFNRSTSPCSTTLTAGDLGLNIPSVKFDSIWPETAPAPDGEGWRVNLDADDVTFLAY